MVYGLFVYFFVEKDQVFLERSVELERVVEGFGEDAFLANEVVGHLGEGHVLLLLLLCRFIFMYLVYKLL